MLYFLEFVVISSLFGYWLYLGIKRFQREEKKQGMDYQILLQGIFGKSVFIILSFIYFIKQESFIHFVIFEGIPVLYESILNIFR